MSSQITFGAIRSLLGNPWTNALFLIVCQGLERSWICELFKALIIVLLLVEITTEAFDSVSGLRRWAITGLYVIDVETGEAAISRTRSSTGARNEVRR
jgi:hypothetical protein